jgi:hypothetical protein
MPTLAGMKPEGYYDENSSFQRVTMEAVVSWMQEAVAGMTLPDEPAPIHIADYGCSEGSNSIAAVGHVVEALRRRRATQPMAAIHADLPSNNFNQLFRNLHDPARTSYLHSAGRAQPSVFAVATAGSFFKPLLPPRSVHFAMSFLAVEWMDKVPDVLVPNFIGYMRGSPAALQAFAEQADSDLTRFYDARARELAPGGRLLIVIPGMDGQRRCSDGLYDVLNDAAWDMVTSGRVERTRFERFAMPVYFRTLAEMTAPLTRSGSPVHGAFRIDRAEVLHLPTPFVEEYRRTGAVERYATIYTNFLRAFSEPVVADGLVGSGGDHGVMDALYGRVRDRLIAEPERYRMENIEVAVLLSRTS